MSLVTNISDLATRISTEVKALRTLINGNQADLSALTTTAQNNLVAAINEIDAAVGAGSPTELDDLTDVVVTGPDTGHILRHNGTNFVNVLGTTHFDAAGSAAAAQSASQPLDSDLTAIAALSTTSYGRAFLALADQAALMALVPSSSETVQGKIELATQAETNTGTDDARAVTPLKFQTRLAAYAQPLDSDLTALAALTTTAYGRALLELADQAAFMALIQSASTTVQGKVELATTAEATTGTDSTRAVTSDGLKAHVDARIDNNSSLGSSTTNAPSQAAVKAYADALIAANDAMVFKGVIDASANPNYPAADKGDTYKISVAGKIGGASGPNVEVGDVIISTADGQSAGTHASVGANWSIVQNNIDGAVTGPASSTSGNFPTFSGTTGKIIQDSGLSLSTSTSLGTSNVLIPSQNAVKVYADTKQTLDATLTALAGVTTAADKLIYATGSDAFTTTDLSSYARTLLDDADAATARGTLSVYSQAEIGDPATDFVAVFEAGLV